MRLPRSPVLLLVCSISLFSLGRVDAKNPVQLRFATFNIAMGLAQPGELRKRLESRDDEGLRKLAAIVQKVRPDVLLLNEFDYQHGIDGAALLAKNYLSIAQSDLAPIVYAYSFDGPVNTGVDSDLELNQNDSRNEAGDAWGYGRFPYQYGMLVLSQLPLKSVRDFRHFRWRDMPAALVPETPAGTAWYPDEIWQQLRLSSKSHWDIKLAHGKQLIHFLVSHPTPPVFDGEEDRNGARNHDEIRLWADYLDPDKSGYIYDQEGATGGLKAGALFVVAGDMNADPVDGDSSMHAILQLLQHPLIDASCVPTSEGALQASREQAGKNLEQHGNPAADSADFNDKFTGNMRVDYVLPSARLKVVGCGVFWPTPDQPGHAWIDVSDHRMVWLDIELER